MQDIKGSQKDLEEIKIDEQPNNEDLNQLEHQLCAIAASVSTLKGVGEHVNVEMIKNEMSSKAILNGNKPFVKPTNPGAYPML